MAEVRVEPVEPPFVGALTNASAREILILNAASAVETSRLEEPALRSLLAMAFRATRVGEGGIDAFLIALDQDAPYDNPNFAWFKARHRRFVYVDRVVTAEAARGRGHARRLYEDLFGAARRAGHALVGCEVNVDPPNPASDAFHRALGFEEIGRAVIAGGRKTVRYLAASV